MRKLVLGIQAQASGKNLTRPLWPSAPQTSCSLRFIPNEGYKTECAMTRRDVGWLCNFTPQTALREIAQPYRFWGLLGFPPRSGCASAVMRQHRVGNLQYDQIAAKRVFASYRRFTAVKGCKSFSNSLIVEHKTWWKGRSQTPDHLNLI